MPTRSFSLSAMRSLGDKQRATADRDGAATAGDVGVAEAQGRSCLVATAGIPS
jgi:hypothetical protein